MKPPSTGTRPASSVGADQVAAPRAGGVHVGDGPGVLGVGDQHGARVDPDRRYLHRRERRRHDPAAGELAHRDNLVMRPRRDVAAGRQRPHRQDQAREFLGERRGQRLHSVGADERRGDAQVPLQQVAQQLRGLIGLPVAGEAGGFDQPVRDLRQRRDDDNRRPGRRIGFQVARHDPDHAAHRFGVGDRGAAELHHHVHRSPSRCISSAFRIAAPAAPRMVLCPSATNL